MADKKVAVTGMKVVSYSVRRVKDTERLKLVLEADVDDVAADMGKVQKALLIHRVSDGDVGLTLLVKDEDEDVTFE